MCEGLFNYFLNGFVTARSLRSSRNYWFLYIILAFDFFVADEFSERFQINLWVICWSMFNFFMFLSASIWALFFLRYSVKNGTKMGDVLGPQTVIATLFFSTLCQWGSLWLPLCSLLVPFLLPLGTFWFPLVPFGFPFGSFLAPLGTLLVPFGYLLASCSPWDPFGSLWLLLGSLLVPFLLPLAPFWFPLDTFWHYVGPFWLPLASLLVP